MSSLVRLINNLRPKNSLFCVMVNIKHSNLNKNNNFKCKYVFIRSITTKTLINEVKLTVEPWRSIGIFLPEVKTSSTRSINLNGCHMFQKQTMNPNVGVAITCLKTTLILYTFIYVITGGFTLILTLGVITVSLLSVLLYALRIPRPPKNVVEKIIGPDPACTDNSEEVVTTIAHRGAGLDAPENSLEAFKQCHAKGVDFIEFDVTLTADYVPIVFHDDSLERMTGVQEFVRSKTYKELETLDIAVKHPYKEDFPNTKIPTLDETIELLLENNQRMFIDIKDNNPHMVDVILSAYERCPVLYERAITTSFFPNIIYMIRKRNPKVVCSLAWRPYPFTHTSYSYAQGLGPRRANSFYMYLVHCVLDWLHETLLSTVTYYILGLSFVLLHKDVISGRVVRDWREKGVRVIAWTVNQPLEKRYFSRVLKITYMTDTLIRESQEPSLQRSITDHLLGEVNEEHQRMNS